ncbi:hypothetical protein Taro_031051 [Colocasia esculenta]|uniref:Uncharacterized protein n=1 Tax=Colocasia esculenta TaxID=4460 RepID=A0A843VQU6_COLES|nr:hypothetical protein [Colocasia esculenta]
MASSSLLPPAARSSFLDWSELAAAPAQVEKLVYIRGRIPAGGRQGRDFPHSISLGSPSPASAETMASSSLLPPAARRLEGKVALVTGGAAGIGESTVRLLCRHGARVVVADIQDKKGEALCSELGGPAVSTYVHCNVTDESHVREAVDIAVATYGKLDIAFSNAGISGSLNPHLVETTKEDFEQVVAVNLTGTFLVIKHAARVMIPARRGSIVITASVASLLGGDGSYAYTSTKHAVVGLCKEAASELGRHGVRVNCVSPFFVATEMTRKGFGVDDDETVEALAESWGILKGVRLKAEDIAEAVLYLASDDAKYVSGHNLVVDGGISVSNCTIRDQ